ncbi:aldehyde dehydrogenase family protein [Acinetobacter shaoyimingii]|uniref:Aldehyde dehydrogenase family protein n=1 Tax=Acinetobacter shaoyimingii TaxID=2715164 RepID=A0A6G8RUX8_9GAMM|nr:aldehyde dehydrogenase family protein [Acinetobacter shaoyimingii]QIO05691.1 aldehyde dehydrogenase family protein [Acinetobacter shaoyimingii]
MSAYQFLNELYISGKWTVGSSSHVINDINPFNQDHILTLNSANQDDVDLAYQAAADAFKVWANSAAQSRVECIERVIQIITARREEMIDLLISESGSTRLKANIEVDAVLAISKEAATFPHRLIPEMLESKNPHRKSWVYKQALGVIAVISPWNFPFHLSMRSVVTAIAIGNTVVLKPASDTPITGGLLLAKLFAEAGLPEGVLNVVTGAGGEIGDYFVQHPVPKMISFTGSTEVGKRVGELAVGGQHLKRVALELGGNAPLVVLDDADLDLAVELTVMGRFLHQGQICMSTNRVIVDAQIYDEFVNKLKVRVQGIAYGDPNSAQTLIGPIINQDQVHRIEQLIQTAKNDGSQLLYGGEIHGNVVPPHIFIDVDPQSSLAQQETFGPVLPIIKANDEAHALALANDTEFGLASAVCTSNRERGLQFALAVDAGMTHINAISVADDPTAPFGGEKNSGLGRFNGQWILDEFSRTHWISVND